MSNGTKKYFYVYYSYELWGRGYIGKRECKCLPEEDVRYFGSFRDKSFKPTEKIILQTFDTVEEARQAEVILHEFYKVDKNPHFANIARAVSEKFYYAAEKENNPFYGRKHTEETKRIISVKKKGIKQDKKVVERRVKSSLKYKYLFVSPNGERYETDSASEFCMKHNLNPSASYQVVKGNWSHHRGWKVFRIEKNIEFTEELIQEHLQKLESIKINNIKNRIGKKDTEETKLKKSLGAKGKKKSKESIEKRTNSFCKYVWTFISPSGEIYETYNCNDLCRKLNLCQPSVGRVARGIVSNYKGWIITRKPRIDEDK